MLFPLLSVVSIVIQVALIVHCVRTGRNTLWIFLLLFAPLVGPIAYVIVELLPGWTHSSGTRRAVRGIGKALDPGQDLRRYEAEAQRTGDVASRQRYAEELVRQGHASEAVGVYQQALAGLYAQDPNLRFGLGRAQFAAGAFSEARATLQSLIEGNRDFLSPEGHLLYARALEAEGQGEQARSEYAAVTRYFAGAEAPLRYAQFLRVNGQPEEARRVLKELLEHARLAPRHYRRMQQEWISSAERELAVLS